MTWAYATYLVNFENDWKKLLSDEDKKDYAFKQHLKIKELEEKINDLCWQLYPDSHGH